MPTTTWIAFCLPLISHAIVYRAAVISHTHRLLILWAAPELLTAVWAKVLVSADTSSNSMGQYRLNPNNRG